MSTASQTADAGREPARAAASPPTFRPLTGLQLWVTAVALALGTFMQVLDSTIANVSIPTISGNLGVSSSQGIWVITAFAVANGVTVPLTGWLMGRYGAIQTFIASVALFTLASLLCGIAWNIESLIGFRIFQGAVSGPMIPGSQALLLMIFPARQRGTAMAIWSMTTLVAPVCGPILGGYISDNFAWEWIFLINVPVGIVCVFLCWRGLAGRETATRKLPIDTVGFAMLLIWVGALQIMLDTGKDAGWFGSPVIVTEACVAAVGFVAWLIWELTEKHPIVDLSLFRSRNFALGSIVFSLAYAVFFGNNLLLPLWLQTQMGYIATFAGLVAAPSGIVALTLTPFAARFLGQVDSRIVATASLAAFGLSFWMRSDLTAQAAFGNFVTPMLVQGIGMSVFFVSMVSLCLKDVSPAQTPSATGLVNFARITAGSFAASLVTTLQENGVALHQTRLVESVPGDGSVLTEAISSLQKTGVSAQQAVGAIAHEFSSQAYLLATLDVFRQSAWICFLMIPLIWLTKRAFSGGAGAVAD